MPLCNVFTKAKRILAHSLLYSLLVLIFIAGLEIEQRASYALASAVPPSYTQPSYTQPNCTQPSYTQPFE